MDKLDDEHFSIRIDSCKVSGTRTLTGRECGGGGGDRGGPGQKCMFLKCPFLKCPVSEKSVFLNVRVPK
jgi:hypothetical protein